MRRFRDRLEAIANNVDTVMERWREIEREHAMQKVQDKVKETESVKKPKGKPTSSSNHHP